MSDATLVRVEPLSSDFSYRGTEVPKRKHPIHRFWYPNAKKEQDPKKVPPVIKAEPVITSQGVLLSFSNPSRRYTPDELRMLARWLYALSHESTDIAASGLISETQSYDVELSKVVLPPADI